MSVGTLLGFLVGNRDAIEKVAQTRSAVWLGLLFVISAGFAREYDGEDLLSEPWHVGLPLAASLVTSFLLFFLICLAGGLAQWKISIFFSEYRRFLGLYWMTAPLAWLYAIPVERWMSPVGAMEANLTLLGLVALWRVVLIIRVISVAYVYLAKWFSALFVVMLFADTVMLVLLTLTPLPVFSIMGGVRLSGSEQMLLSTSMLAIILGLFSWPIWAIGALSVIWMKVFQPYAAREQYGKCVVSKSAWALGIVALLIWIPILPSTQPEQQLRHAVEQDLQNGDIARALATMSAHERTDFPPYWDPPPRIGYGENKPAILVVTEVVIENDVAIWVRELYQEKFEDFVGIGYHPQMLFDEMDNEEFSRYLDLMEKLPVSPEFLENHRDALQWQMSSKNLDRTEVQKSRLRKLLGIKDDNSTPDSQKIELEIGPTTVSPQIPEEERPPLPDMN